MQCFKNGCFLFCSLSSQSLPMLKFMTSILDTRSQIWEYRTIMHHRSVLYYFAEVQYQFTVRGIDLRLINTFHFVNYDLEHSLFNQERATTKTESIRDFFLVRPSIKKIYCWYGWNYGISAYVRRIFGQFKYSVDDPLLHLISSGMIRWITYIVANVFVPTKLFQVSEVCLWQQSLQLLSVFWRAEREHLAEISSKILSQVNQVEGFDKSNSARTFH